MTQVELKDLVFYLIKIMIEKQSYIKGYGTMYRVMDSLHSPIRNIDKSCMNVLLENKIVERDGLIYKLIVNQNPFTKAAEVKLPVK